METRKDQIENEWYFIDQIDYLFAASIGHKFIIFGFIGLEYVRNEFQILHYINVLQIKDHRRNWSLSLYWVCMKSLNDIITHVTTWLLY